MSSHVIVTSLILAFFLSSEDIKNTVCILIGSSLSVPFSILYICINTIGLILLSMFCIAIMVTVTKSSKVSTTNDSSLIIFRRIMAIIITNLLPSITLSLLSVLALSNVNFPATLEANVAFFIFPVNASLNPIINTITTTKFLTSFNVHIITLIKPLVVAKIKQIKTKCFCKIECLYDIKRFLSDQSFATASRR